MLRLYKTVVFGTRRVVSHPCVTSVFLMLRDELNNTAQRTYLKTYAQFGLCLLLSSLGKRTSCSPFFPRLEIYRLPDLHHGDARRYK